MYSKYDIPYFSACLYYYDTDYSRETSSKVLTILEKYGMFPPKKIYADKLTGNRYIAADANTKEIFVNAYAEEDVFQIEMINDDSPNVKGYWGITWIFTYYKRSGRTNTGTFKPWNTLYINSAPNRLNDVATFESYLQCIKELIDLIQPFYASVDDAGNWVRLMHKKKVFTPEKIQEVFWGNYWGVDFCKTFGLDMLNEIPVCSIQNLGNGVFFTLTDHICDFNSKAANMTRKKVKRYLKIGGRGRFSCFLRSRRINPK